MNLQVLRRGDPWHNFYDRQVQRLVFADHLSIDFSAVLQGDLYFVRSADDVLVGEDVSFFINDKTGAGPLLGNDPVLKGELTLTFFTTSTLTTASPTFSTISAMVVGPQLISVSFLGKVVEAVVEAAMVGVVVSVPVPGAGGAGILGAVPAARPIDPKQMIKKANKKIFLFFIFSYLLLS
jgi:hypothetical protein